MSVLTIGVIVIILLIVQGIGLWLLYAFQKRGAGKGGSDGMLLLQQQVQELARTLDARVAESTKAMQESAHRQISESNRIVRDVTDRLAKLDETNRQVVSFADQLQNLQDVLQNPKQRGILGEYYLETVLKNVLPPGSYQMQYAFKNGEVVDAVVFVKERVIPIDSKFSLENYNRAIEARDPAEREAFEKQFKQDLKLRIDETSKYVRPEENTMEFAFMFIPSEGIYYDLLMNQVGAMKTQTRDLIEYAFNKKVIIVSPTSFLAYLQTVLQGLKALQIEEQAEEIKKRVGELGKHIGSYEEYHKKLGASLGITVSHYNASYKELGKIDKDVYRIAGAKIEIEPALLEKPSVEA
ncbi:DNA recombination protein RmuC [Candidatus Kaiserbacteria bacterium]|nr:DNA recombination protein RmuC [Candidatus Kaiserbacteria bacterium]